MNLRTYFVAFLFLALTGCASSVENGMEADAVITPMPDASPDVVISETSTDTRPLEAASPDAPSPDASPEAAIDVVPDVTHPRAEVIIEAHNQPASTILVADSDIWYSVDQYRLSVRNDDFNLDGMNVFLFDEAASYQEVAIANNGAILGRATPPSGMGVMPFVRLTTPLLIPRDNSVTIQIWVKLARIQAPTPIAPTRRGFALSGNNIQTSLTAVGGRGVLTDDFTVTIPTPLTGGNRFVARKTRIIITPAVMDMALSNSRHALATWQVSAHAAGSAGFKKIGFYFTCTGSIQLANLRLNRGATELQPMVYRIVDAATGTDLHDSITPCRNGVLIYFTNEEILAGSGNSYRLTAEIRNANPGDIIQTWLIRYRVAPSVTGRLTEDNLLAESSRRPTYASLAGPFIDLTSSDGIPNYAVDDLIWSDMSDAPHNRTSLDWIGQEYVEDLTHGWSLTYP